MSASPTFQTDFNKGFLTMLPLCLPFLINFVGLLTLLDAFMVEHYLCCFSKFVISLMSVTLFFFHYTISLNFLSSFKLLEKCAY